MKSLLQLAQHQARPVELRTLTPSLRLDEARPKGALDLQLLGSEANTCWVGQIYRSGLQLLAPLEPLQLRLHPLVLVHQPIH